MKKYDFLVLIFLSSVVIFTINRGEREGVEREEPTLVPFKTHKEQEQVESDEDGQVTETKNSNSKSTINKALYCNNLSHFNVSLTRSEYPHPEEVALYLDIHNTKIRQPDPFSIENRTNMTFELALQLKKAIIASDLNNYKKLIESREINLLKLGNDTIYSFFIESYTTSDFLYLLIDHGYKPVLSDITKTVDSRQSSTLKSELINLLKGYLLNTSDAHALRHLNDLFLLMETPSHYDFSTRKSLEASIASLLSAPLLGFNQEKAVKSMTFFGYEHAEAVAKIDSLLKSHKSFSKLLNEYCAKPTVATSHDAAEDMGLTYKQTFALFESQQLIQDLTTLSKHEQWEMYIEKANFYASQHSELLTIFYMQALQRGAPEHVILSLYNMGVQPQNEDIALLAMQNKLGILEKYAPIFDFGYVSENGMSAMDYCIKTKCNLAVVKFLLKEQPDMKISQASLEVLNSPEYQEYQAQIRAFSSTY
ncbi:hypothetical protein [Pseudoalteromonas sp. T1lg23B]|uniref:hypothetical protein n=1 Tax=Pseudoalteromonas sp. T1lg23B TaxID=2077097 RepID=UPI000CF609E3|nr:hypothetical protein [Pseudoalteromonas sp. T1lg23B]